MKTTWQCSKALWEDVVLKVNRAVVYVDDPCAELLHWQGGMARLLEAGAVDVREFSSFEKADPNQKKAVFIVSSMLRDSVTRDVLKDVVEQSNFQYVVVISTVSSNVLAFDRTGSAEVDDKHDFDEIEDLLLQWMGNMNYTAEIFHIPLFTADICPGLFVTPAFSQVFPLLETDVQHVQLQYNTAHKVKGDKASFTSLSEIECQYLPKALQVTFKRLACCFHALLSDLGVREDLYSMGHTSRLLATEIENYPPAKIRRKNVSNRASVILIDRTLDLASPAGHQLDTLLDKITSVLPSLPRHNADVMVDMTPLCSIVKDAKNVIVPGSLASGSFSSQPIHLQNLVFGKHKANQDVVTAEQIDTTLSLFKGNYAAIESHLDTLQVAMATSQALKHQDTSRHDNLLSTEKNLVQLVGDDSSAGGLSHILTLLKGQLQLPANQRSHSLDDVLMVLTFLYSLSGGDCGDEELEVQDQLVEAILAEKSDLPPVIHSIVGDAVSGSIVRDLLEDVWSKLEAVGTARDDLKNFQSILEPSTAISPASMKPLLKTIVEQIFSPDKPELVDLEFKSSGLKDFLKSGFGLFMNVSKPGPSDHPLLLVFVVGGVTATEVKQVRDVVDKMKLDKQVVIGSTKLLRGTDVLQSIFCQNNVDPDAVM
ncbi:sec1 family domain-containing protein 2-like [Haliotis rubra]|uniref:sec1 family domain-containing protein 2-like n=1 Tax=Haliotis rubra TaxID=36100 RepID=UPI001EE59BDC|nr:sec1 family domain-containing protein 2-like [Haliotis rubra]